ncbi:MAG: M48 family metallopeptidase [Chitinophagaceae bacterium]|nr:M48 family metallopeptidase [Chitinophagaceae bacterium]MCW5905294.1 M48 family metallopeptidase [Chitinophagaceae bacterium]
MKLKFIVSTIITSVLLSSCYTNKITGRSQISLVAESEVQTMAKTEYRQFLSQNKVVSTATNKDAEMVNRVGKRIAAAITKYYSEQGLANELQGYEWEYHLVESNEVNAWCMPGGKIVVYTGILPITQNEAALAVVMGHEIAHALARHGNERMSEGLLQQLGGVALSTALSTKPQQTQNLFMTAYGVSTQVGFMLPHSRKQELEADKFGLRYAALAGYNIREAIPLWQRMGKLSQGQKPPIFLSTHPTEEKRIQELNKIMDETIRDYYRPMVQ